MRRGREIRGGGRFERREHGVGFGGGSGFGGGFGGGGFREPPVHVGEEHDVTITDIAAKGDGIAKIEGFIVFVPGTSTGESCKVRINEVRHRFAIAEKIGGAGAGGAIEESEIPPEAIPTEAGNEAGEEGEETGGKEGEEHVG